MPVPAPPDKRNGPEYDRFAYLRCSGWRNTRHAPKSPSSITRRSSALFSIHAKDIWAAGCRSPSTRRSSSLAARLRRCRRLAETQLLLDLRDAETYGEVEERHALPLDGVVEHCHQRVPVRCGKGAGGERLVDPQDIDEDLAVKTQADEQRDRCRRRALGGSRLGPAKSAGRRAVPPRRW